MTRGDWAWLILTGGIVAYEVSVPRSDLLSSAADHWIEKHPIGVRAAILLVGTALTTHVGNFHPRPDLFDAISTDFFLWKRLARSFS